mgnify:CR=1 FL=1
MEIFKYSVPSYLRINEEKTVKRITNFIRDYIKESGVAGVVLGLSGGSDSSVTAALAVRALGPSRVNALIMPDKESSPRSVSDAERVAKLLGIRYVRIDITPVVSSVLGAFRDDYSKAPKIPKGNVKARARMILLYYMANKENLIVLGTSDKSEWLLGYFTKWGDAAADVYPLINLYKSQVRLLGDYLGLPEDIIWKPSTPDLWVKHRASEELGADYDVIDPILYHYVELSLSPEVIANKLNIDLGLVKSIVGRISLYEHKRKMIKGPEPVY